MFKRLIKISIATLMMTAPVAADQFGNWNRDNIKGYETYWTVNSDGARFTIWCPPDNQVKNALIGIDINGKLPKASSVVKVEVGRRLVKFNTDRDGYIRTDCTTCADNLTYFWNLMRSSAHLKVLLDDRRHAGFSLRGAREVFPSAVCAPIPGRQASR
ncbi:MAG: hypothetical protein ABJL55_11960 [Roseibium sp.]